MLTLPTRKFNLSEYHRLTEMGIFATDERLELIRGEIIKKFAKTTYHTVCSSLLLKELFIMINKRAIIRTQDPIILGNDSEPEPDLVIAKRKEDNYFSSHPTPDDIILVIEISDSSLRLDQEVKLPLYAQYQIPHYWILNVIDNCLETYSHPFQDKKGKWKYRHHAILTDNETVTIPNFPDISLNLTSIFPQTNS
ncbi:MAG TPA: Uma2 family endonuclease [Allocoleopsis sp.]